MDEGPRYCVKGVLYQGTRAYFDANVLGGYQGLLERLPPDLRAFMEQPFVAGGRYDVMPVADLLQHEAAAAGKPLELYLDERTRWQAQQDLTGIYRLIARVAPVHVVISRLLVVMTQMFSFGEPTIERPAPGELRVQIAGIPRPLVDWLQHSMLIYSEVCLQIARARHFKLGADPPTRGPDGTQTLRFQVRWKA